MEEALPSQAPHIAFVPTPGLGHLIPLIELATKLVLRHSLAATFLIPGSTSSSSQLQSSILNGLPSSISYSFLPPVDLTDLPADTLVSTRVSLTLTRSLPPLRDSLAKLAESTQLAALVVDLFGASALDLAHEFGASPYLFFPCSALTLSSILAIPKLDQMFTCEYRDLPEPLEFFPGCVPVHGADLLLFVQDRKSEAYKYSLNLGKQYRKAAGIMVNSFLDLEPAAFKSFEPQQDGDREKLPPIYPVGPLVQSGPGNGLESEKSLKWLDDQPRGSVLFVSFGSGGTLSSTQITELAFGLEMSEKRFLWVIRCPNDKQVNAAYFNQYASSNPVDFLPEGFLERTKGVGLVVPDWAPQSRILSHGSTGGFLTHCGWNSTLESIVNGVALIAWPLFAEQRTNAVLLADGLKVAVRVKPNEEGLVGRDQIAKYVDSLIDGEEGKAMKERMVVLQRAAAAALDGEGSSSQSLNEIAATWKSLKP